MGERGPARRSRPPWGSAVRGAPGRLARRKGATIVSNGHASAATARARMAVRSRAPTRRRVAHGWRRGRVPGRNSRRPRARSTGVATAAGRYEEERRAAGFAGAEAASTAAPRQHRPTRVMAARTGAGRGPERPPALQSLSMGGRRGGNSVDRPRPRWAVAPVEGWTARPPGRPRRRGRAGSAGWSVRRCSSETPIRLRSRNPVASPAASAPAPARPPTDPSTGPRRRGRRRCRGLTAPVRPPRPSPSPAPVRSPASTAAGLSVQDPRDWAECREAGLLEQWARVVT